MAGGENAQYREKDLPQLIIPEELSHLSSSDSELETEYPTTPSTPQTPGTPVTQLGGGLVHLIFRKLMNRLPHRSLPRK